jgi:hypothetical protein
MRQMTSPGFETDRRRSKRIVTLRNFGFFTLAVLIVIALLNIRSEMRDATGEDYGRLYGREIKKAPPVEAIPVTERAVAPVDEGHSADPFSLEAAKREQYLGSPTLTPEPVISADTMGWGSTAPRPDAANVRIVGGAEGVELVQEEAARTPKLSGGFGRKP